MPPLADDRGRFRPALRGILVRLAASDHHEEFWRAAWRRSWTTRRAVNSTWYVHLGPSLITPTDDVLGQFARLLEHLFLFFPSFSRRRFPSPKK